MAKEEDVRQKEKKNRKDKDRERDKEHERESKRSRKDKDEDTSAKPDHTLNRGKRSLEAPQQDTELSGSDVKPRVEDSNGEVSMNIEETNRVRASLGLKPLDNTSAEDDKRARAAAIALRAKEEKKANEEEVAERIKAKKEKRLQQEELRNIKTLGESGEDVDDLAAWVERNRKAEAQLKAEERAKAEKLARQLEEQDDVDSDEEAVTNPQELAGMKVKHNTEELKEGETMILTLADRSILNDKGDVEEDPEELENVLVTEDKLRRKAFKAAAKENKPLFGEDGKVRGLLEKYDEEEQEAGMEIDATGAVEEAKRKKQEDIRARLRAAESASTAAAAPSFDSKGDFYTQEEMAQFQKPKTKKKRKLRKKEAGTEEGGLDLASLEAEAATHDTGRDRGSRAQRATRDQQEAAAQEAELQKRKERYDNALNKANVASLALQQPAEAQDDFADDADDDLQASLVRARRAAQLKAAASKPSVEDVAAEAARRREEQERAALETEGGLEFSEAKDFANSIQLVKTEEPATAEEPASMDTKMEEVEEKPPAPAPLPPPPPRAATEPRLGSWVPADKVKEEQPVDEDMPDAPPVKPEVKPHQPQEAPESLVREKTVGVGLAGAMALLRERGELAQEVQWAGRTNDMKKNKLQGLEEVYRGGSHEDTRAANIERALTERDEFGRVLTPKERFRLLCHNFHGKTISKGKQEKRLRKLAEEMDAKRAATGEGSVNAFTRLQAAQVAGTPYVILSGKMQPGQSSDPASGFATVDRHAPTPVLGGATPKLGGGQTPLMGDHKVEVMLGLKREGHKGDRTMPPPGPRNVRK